MGLMKRNALRRSLALPLALAAGAALLSAPSGAALLAAEEKAEAQESGDAEEGAGAREKDAKGKAAAPKVYTNKDLERYRDLASLGLPAGAVVIDTAPPTLI